MISGVAEDPGRWASYLRDVTERPGWSVARLARESGIHRSTIFRWLSGKGGVTVASVRAIAEAISEDPEMVLRAAAEVLERANEEPAIRKVLASDLPQNVKDDLVAHLRKRQVEDQRRLEAEIDAMIELARKSRN